MLNEGYFNWMVHDKTGWASLEGGLRAANLGRHNKEFYTYLSLANYSIILSQLINFGMNFCNRLSYQATYRGGTRPPKNLG